MGELILLDGIVDYALGCDVKDTIYSNIIVVEAKRKYEIGRTYGQ